MNYSYIAVFGVHSDGPGLRDRLPNPKYELRSSRTPAVYFRRRCDTYTNLRLQPEPSNTIARADVPRRRRGPRAAPARLPFFIPSLRDLTTGRAVTAL